MKFGKPTIQYVMSASTDRPAWTSTAETGIFDAYKHRHSIEQGRFVLRKHYFNK